MRTGAVNRIRAAHNEQNFLYFGIEMKDILEM